MYTVHTATKKYNNNNSCLIKVIEIIEVSSAGKRKERATTMHTHKILEKGNKLKKDGKNVKTFFPCRSARMIIGLIEKTTLENIKN